MCQLYMIGVYFYRYLIHTYSFTYTHHIYIDTHTYIYIHGYTCICMYIYICIHLRCIYPHDTYLYIKPNAQAKASRPPKGKDICHGNHPKWWFRKGIPPKISETIRLMIYNTLSRSIYLPYINTLQKKIKKYICIIYMNINL